MAHQRRVDRADRRGSIQHHRTRSRNHQAARLHELSSHPACPSGVFRQRAIIPVSLANAPDAFASG
jgi:hypothetical protein